MPGKTGELVRRFSKPKIPAELGSDEFVHEVYEREAVRAYAGMMAGVRFVNDEIRKGILIFDPESFYNKLHKIVMGPLLQEEHLGRYRTRDVWIDGGHLEICSWDEVPLRMKKYARELKRRTKYLGFGVHLLPDVLNVAAYGHFGLVEIHPYIDGSGRVARLGVDYMLKVCGYKTIVVGPTDRQSYLRALDNVVVTHDLSYFVLFMAKKLRERYQHESDGRVVSKLDEVICDLSR